MEDRRLRHFLAVAEAGQYGKAAESLGFSTQGLSRSIASLEKDLGFQLFERGQFGARLTQFGNALIPHARLIVAQGQAAAAELRSLQTGLAGSLAIGGGVSFMADIVPRALARLLADRPQIDVTVSTEDWHGLVAGLRSGALDLIATVLPESEADDSDLEIDILFRQRFALFAASNHPLADKRGITLRDAQRFPWIMNAGETRASNVVYRRYLNAGLPQPKSVIETRLDSIFTRSMMQARPCVVHGSKDFFIEGLRTGSVVELDAPDLVTDRPAALVRLKNRPSTPAARILMREIRTVLAASGRSGTGLHKL